jgi:hypothetical protein
MAMAQTYSSSRFMEFLTTPWVDKTIAAIAVTPNSIELYHRYSSANLTFVRSVLGIQSIILIVTMLLRRSPVRVTPNPWYWLLAFVASYGIITFVGFTPTGTPLVQGSIPNTLAIIAATIMIYARHRVSPRGSRHRYARRIPLRTAPDLHRVIHRFACVCAARLFAAECDARRNPDGTLHAGERRRGALLARQFRVRRVSAACAPSVVSG